MEDIALGKKGLPYFPMTTNKLIESAFKFITILTVEKRFMFVNCLISVKKKKEKRLKKKGFFLGNKKHLSISITFDFYVNLPEFCILLLHRYFFFRRIK